NEKRRAYGVESAVTPPDIRVVAFLNVETFLAFFGGFNPVDDRDMDISFARPCHAGHGLGDGSAIANDVIKPRLAAVVLANGVCTNEPRPLSLLEMIVGASKPIDAIIRTPIYLRITSAQAVDVTAIHFRL